jgi:hypothetical protein
MFSLVPDSERNLQMEKRNTADIYGAIRHCQRVRKRHDRVKVCLLRKSKQRGFFGFLGCFLGTKTFLWVERVVRSERTNNE